MTDQWWVSLRPDGLVEQQVCEEQRPEGGGWHRVDRPGDLARETWRPRRGWTDRPAEDLHAAIDRAHHADHGQWTLPISHAVKEIEARLLFAGVPLEDGRLAREARARGLDPQVLAAKILERADQDERELDRVAAKVAVTKPDR